MLIALLVIVIVKTSAQEKVQMLHGLYLGMSRSDATNQILNRKHFTYIRSIDNGEEYRINRTTKLTVDYDDKGKVKIVSVNYPITEILDLANSMSCQFGKLSGFVTDEETGFKTGYWIVGKVAIGVLFWNDNTFSTILQHNL